MKKTLFQEPYLTAYILCHFSSLFQAFFTGRHIMQSAIEPAIGHVPAQLRECLIAARRISQVIVSMQGHWEIFTKYITHHGKYRSVGGSMPGRKFGMVGRTNVGGPGWIDHSAYVRDRPYGVENVFIGIQYDRCLMLGNAHFSI